MIKEEILEKISQFFKLSQFEAENIFNDIINKIIDGVKKDSIVDIGNFGEFIIKFNDSKSSEGLSTENKKSIEFLPSTSLEEEIGHRRYDLLVSTAYKSEDVSEVVKNDSESSVKPKENEINPPIEQPPKVVETEIKTEERKIFPIPIKEEPVKSDENISD